jgi:hypothetical protein
MFVVEPLDDGRSWTYTLRTAEGEVLAVAGRPFATAGDCVAAIDEIVGPYEFDLTVQQRRDGRWSWAMGKSGRPLLISPRTHPLPGGGVCPPRQPGSRPPRRGMTPARTEC